MKKALRLVVIVTGWTLVTMAPSIGAEGGTVNATVVAAPPPCITLDRTNVDFGTLSFVTAPGISGVQTVAVTNCAGGGFDESLLVSATDATTAIGSPVWSLQPTVDPCTAGIDVFGLGVQNLGGGGTAAESGLFNPVGSVPAAGAASVDLELTMPCQGSNGQGESFGFDVNFLVTIP